MHQASPVDGSSDRLNDSPLVMGELNTDFSEESLNGGQPEVESIEGLIKVDPTAAEVMTELEEDPRGNAEILDQVSALEAESSPEGGNAEEVPESMDAEVDCPEEEKQRLKEGVIEASGEAHMHTESSSKEPDMEFNFVIQDLKHELRRLEEENQLLKSSSNESTLSMDSVLLENAHLKVEGSKLVSENQKYKEEGLELVAELEALKEQLQVGHASHTRLESETVTLRQEKEHELSRLSSQIMDIEGQLHKLEEEHSSVLAKSKDLESKLEIIDDENIKLKGQVVSVLEGSQKREEELVGMLESCQEHVRTLDVEQHNLLSTIEMSNAAMCQLEGQNATMSSEFEQERQIAENKIADLASELQLIQDQQHKLHSQLQGLREENTHVVIKASKLDQLVEELESDKLRLSGDLERLVQDRERREEELDVELRTYREHVQSLEVEKLTLVTLVDKLTTQVRELEEDNRQLTGLSDEARQSVQHLWEENTRLIEGYNRLEQEKQAHEGERMELVAGIQTVWEQLHAANDREALLASELQGLSERRDAEEAFFDQKIRDLELQLKASDQEKSDLNCKSEEISEVLDALREETSRKLKDLQEEKVQLVDKVSDLEKLKAETEQAVSMKQLAWETQVQGLESEKAAATTKVEGLEQQLQISREEIKDLNEKDTNSNQLIQELREEIARLSSEIDKLEEVKERQEGERLELAAELQAAWDQIQAVRDSEANLATELSELKDQRNEEKLRSDGLVLELRRQLQELEEKTTESEIKVEQLSKRLNELRKEQELQDENERLAAEIILLEQEKSKILTEREVLLTETVALQHRVLSLEFDKSKMAFEIEELNQWLQGPAAEKKQLAANLDEMTQLLKGLELERTQLAISVSELQEERERIQLDVGKLQDVINVLEEEKSKSLLVHEDSIRQLESLEEQKQHAVRIQEESALLVLNLKGKIHVLEEESTRMISVHDDSLLRIQSLENEKIVMESLLEEQCAGLNQLHLKNTEHVDAVGKLEGELELRNMEVQLLKGQVFSLEEENLSMKTLHGALLSQLLVLETAKSQAEKSVEEFTDLNVNLMEQLHNLEAVKESNLRLHEQVVSLGEEKSQLQQSMEASQLLVQGLHLGNSELSGTISGLEAELMKRHEEIQMMSGHLSDLEEEKESCLSQHKELLARFELMDGERNDFSKSLDMLNSSLEKLQAENSDYIDKANSLEEKMERKQAEVQRFEEQTASLSAAHQDSLLHLQVLGEEKGEMAKALDALNSSAQMLQAENLELVTKAESLEEEVERRLAEIQGCQDALLQLETLEEEKAELVKSLHASKLCVQELQVKDADYVNRVKMLEDEVAQGLAEVQRLKETMEILSCAYQYSLLQLDVLREEKGELVNSLDAFNSAVQDLQVKNEHYTNTVKILEDDVLRRQAESQRLDQEMDRLLAAHQKSLLQLQTLEEEKAELANSLDSSNLLVQKLQTQNLEHMSKADSLVEELERKQGDVQGLEEKIESLSIVYQNSLLQVQTLEEERAGLVNSRITSDLCVQELEAKIVENIDAIKILEEEVAQGQADVQRLEEQTGTLSLEHQNTLGQLQALAEEKDELTKTLGASNLSVEALQLGNLEHISLANSVEVEMKSMQAEMQRLDQEMGILSVAHQDTLLQLDALEEEKAQLMKSLNASNSSVQELQVENADYVDRVNILEEEVAQGQAEVQRLEEKIEILSSAHQDSLLQLDVLKEEKAELVNSLDVFNFLVQELQVKNRQHMNAVKTLEDEVAVRQTEVQSLEKQTGRLSITHQDTLFQLQALAEEKVEMVKSLDASILSVQELRRRNDEHTDRVKILEEDVAQGQAVVQRLEKKTDSLSTAHEESLIKLQGLEVHKLIITNQLEECQGLIQKLHADNLVLASDARNFEEQLYRRQDKMESLDSPVHSLDEKEFRETSEYLGVPLQVPSLEDEEAQAERSLGICNTLVEQLELETSKHSGITSINGEDRRSGDANLETLCDEVPKFKVENRIMVSLGGEVEVQHEFLEADKVKCSKLLEHSGLMMKKLESENMQLCTAVSKLEKHLCDESQILREQVQSLEAEREKFGLECVAKIRSLEEEKSQLVKVLEESNLAVVDLHSEIGTLKVCVLDLERGKDDLANQISLLQEQTCDIVAERDQFSSEMQGLREQLQEYVERLEESENIAKKSKEEALELAKQLETFREQVVKLSEHTNQFRQLETPKQLGCTLNCNGDLVTNVEPRLDRLSLSNGQVEISHLMLANVDPREELQQASLGWVEIISTVCQELAKLLRSVGEEKEKLARNQGMSHQKTEVLTNLCQELDMLILGVREKTERFAEELSCLKHKLAKSNNERGFLGDDADVNVENCQQLPTVVTAENRELMLDVETSCPKLQSSHVGNTELEAHVATLSTCLENSQGQLKALVIKSSAGNPYLLTSRADDGGHRKGLACFSADGNCVLNYGSDIRMRRSIKTLEQEKKEKKGNGTLPTFSQRTQTPGRSFKKCKVNVQQPKRRWIF